MSAARKRAAQKAAEVSAAKRKHPPHIAAVARVRREMIYRCTCPTNKDYPHYGGRGIRVCDRWMASAAAFAEDMGPRPDGTTIDRIHNDGDYEPGNCRWADATTQNTNRRVNVWVELDGVRQTVMQWAQQIGCTYRTLKFRLDRWDVRTALTTPIRPKRTPARRS